MNTAMNLSVIPLLSTYRDFEDRVTCHRLCGYSLTSDYLTVFHNFVRVAYDATDPGKGRLGTMRGELHTKIKKLWH